MFRSVLVPLDGSRFGEQALPLALTVARRAGARLELVHKHVPPAPLHPDGMLAREHALDTTSRAQEQAYLDGVAGRLARAGNITVTSALVEGPTVEALDEHAVGTGADLVVMTTHGRGPLSRFWLGSVADALLRRLPMPVLLVRPGEEEEPDRTAAPALRHVLVPLDGSPHAEEILKPALALGALTGADYTLLRVVEPVPVVGVDLPGYAAAGTDLASLDKLQGDARVYLNGVAARLRGQGLHVQTRVAVNAQAAGAILDEAGRRGQDLIALETHGRGGLARLLLGSVADKVLRGATTPVLVHRTPEK